MAGAGFGVDSGLPDFRGPNGFYKAYPYFEKVGMNFQDAANPQFFKKDPKRFWYFYGHRHMLYANTEPNQGYMILNEWAKNDFGPDHHFVFTSNVDHQFQKAGISDKNIYECHGSIFVFQCDKCNIVEERLDEKFELDENTYETESIPECQKCQSFMRPNCLMFGDFDFNEQVSEQQDQRYKAWLENIKDQSLLIIEIGAGSAVPTVRLNSEDVLTVLRNKNTNMIRINPAEQNVYRATKKWINIIDKNIANEMVDSDIQNLNLEMRYLVQVEAGGKDTLVAIDNIIKKQI
ncbi:silent information regulator protein sir2 [Stylonychia lemnae]|uniref:Silent information regulator protein sir2 n=1 Tax=Stylonychia lemnae TaxID=5949 RepID=A0A078AVF3_STYLE|nr:silent information regulator protein sir2 [Stylonychia lemnae]|eukprot:CDW84808.1 silent information regulator protein sir2 [Stylonychia lemnae]